MKFDQPPDDVEWNSWGPPVRVSIDAGPVMLFARAVKDDAAVYASERAARDAGFEHVPVPPTYTFVMANAGAFPDLQPADGTGSMYPSSDIDSASRFGRDGLFLHGEQHFTYHRPVYVGDVLEGRMRTSKPITRARGAARWKSHTFRRRGPISNDSPSSTSASFRSSFPTSDRPRSDAGRDFGSHGRRPRRAGPGERSEPDSVFDLRAVRCSDADVADALTVASSSSRHRVIAARLTSSVSALAVAVGCSSNPRLRSRPVRNRDVSDVGCAHRNGASCCVPAASTDRMCRRFTGRSGENISHMQ